MTDWHKVMPLEGHDISWWEPPFLGNIWYVPCVVLRAHLAGPLLQDKPANGPHIVQAPSPYSLQSIASLTFVKGSLCGEPEAMRWEQRVYFAIFHTFMCPLGK